MNGSEVRFADFPQQPPKVEGLTPQLMKRWKVVPFDSDDDKVLLAVAEMPDVFFLDILTSLCGRGVQCHLTRVEDINRVLYRWYEEHNELASEENGASTDHLDIWEDPERLRNQATEEPVIKLVDEIIFSALERAASDIHFEPFRDQFIIRYRVDGVLHDTQRQVPATYQPAVISRLKLMARMKIDERRLPQDGRIRFAGPHGQIDIRVSSVPTQFGESMVLRLLGQEEVQLDFASLGMPPEVMRSFRRMITRAYGLILVTGPTGSGKTTTLYTAINSINSPDKKILTIEDPVEYQLQGVNQIQVKPKIGLTFASALRSFLRQDPDVILVGEIRDTETAEIAIHAALTGHLVFSTLHTNDSAGAITRLQEMGVEPYLLTSSLLGVLAQRLVRCVCPQCAQSRPFSEETIQHLRDIMGQNGAAPVEEHHGAGCAFCGGRGYRGRTGVYEWMEMSDRIRQLVLKQSDSLAIGTVAQSQGMHTLLQAGIAKVAAGVTTFEEILRVANVSGKAAETVLEPLE
jgi:general secretion pathway protein E